MSPLRRRLAGWLAPLCLAGAWGVVPAWAQSGGEAASAAASALDARAWLGRIHGAANTRNYQGTMVLSAEGVISSSRVAHFCVGTQVYERIEALDGKQRQVLRHNDLVHTVWPQAGKAVIERRGLQSSLPSATQSVDPRALEQYELRAEGRDRVAGREARVFLLQPRDELRFAQRIWADLESGLMLRSDVIGPGRVVLESSAFSEVEINVRAQPETVLQAIRALERLKVYRPQQTPTQLEAQGWTLARPVAGFSLASCTKRPVEARAADGSALQAEVTQAVFSDGLTHVSVFIEPFDAQRHRQEILAKFGATHSLTGRRGDHWITAMGDVPAATLKRFIEALERRP